MEMFGYTPEGAKQEAKRLASDINTDLTFKEAATNVGSMLPGIGTAMTVAEIEEELKKETPSYGKIALLGGSEIIGLIPGLGTAAKAGLRAAAKKVGANKVVDALDAIPDPKDVAKDEMMIGPGGRDYYNEDLKKALELEKKGVSPEKIEQQTGRVKSAGELMDDFTEFPSFDSVYKFEIDDRNAQFVGQYKIKEGDAFTKPTFAKTRDATETNPAFLGQVLDHPILFEQYPDLKKVKFAFVDDLDSSGLFDHGENMVSIHSKYKSRSLNDPFLRDVLFHEVQHAAQFQDFLKQGYRMLGGGPDYFAKVVGQPNKYLSAKDKGVVLDANAVLGDDKLISARDDLMNFYNKYKDTDDLSYNLTYPEGLKKVVSPTDARTPLELHNIEIGLGQLLGGVGKLNFEPKNPKVIKQFAEKSFKFQEELYRKYLQLGVEKEARLTGQRAKKFSSDPNIKFTNPLDPLSPEVTKQSKIKTIEEFRKNKPDNFFIKKLKDFDRAVSTRVRGTRLAEEKDINRFADKGFLFVRYAIGQDKKLSGFAKGGDTVRPEPRPDIVDVSPMAEASDQDLIKKDDLLSNIKPKLKPETRPFPDVKPKARPDSDEYRGRTYDIYSVEIDGNDMNVIEFKDGKRISSPQILQMFAKYASATETFPGEQTSKEILKFLEDNNPTYDEFVRHFTAKRINKGGLIGDQMQMAFMSEGGLTDDGMNTDPVSGNEVPSGSMAEEVRDDIPAQLSEGEYVVPADVVRYYGVKFFEDLRDQAKIGLAEMEANGRIGGEPVPDGGPMNTQELSPEEMQAIQEIMGMSLGGSVEADMLGGKTSAQVEQDMLARGSSAKAQNYTGSPLGFSIFDSPNTQVQTASLQGVQQTDAKAFTPIVLYNKSGQTRTVNSIEERKSAEAAGFTMTLEQYNMYRSQRGGGGSDPKITTPGGEEKEDKPWGAQVNWDDPDAIRKFVDDAKNGNIDSSTGRFLQGAGFSLAGMTGVGLVAAFQVGQGFKNLQDMQAAQIIAEARGHTNVASEIGKDIEEYKKQAGGIINFLDKIFPTANKHANNVAKYKYGVDSFEDIPDINEEIKPKISKAGISKGSTGKGQAPAKFGRFDSMSDTDRATVIKDITGVDVSGEQAPAGSGLSDPVTGDTTPSSAGPFNKGGLMTKGKKKKKK